MVEGLTSSATDLGSVAGIVIGPDQLRESKIDATNGARTSPRGPCRSQPNNHTDATNPGDTGGEAIPVPIPNTEVKLSSAEDTERAAFRENRSSPGFLRFSVPVVSRRRRSAGHGDTARQSTSLGLVMRSARSSRVS